MKFKRSIAKLLAVLVATVGLRPALAATISGSVSVSETKINSQSDYQFELNLSNMMAQGQAFWLEFRNMEFADGASFTCDKNYGLGDNNLSCARDANEASRIVVTGPESTEFLVVFTVRGVTNPSVVRDQNIVVKMTKPNGGFPD